MPLCEFVVAPADPATTIRGCAAALKLHSEDPGATQVVLTREGECDANYGSRQVTGPHPRGGHGRAARRCGVSSTHRAQPASCKVCSGSRRRPLPLIVQAQRQREARQQPPRCSRAIATLPCRMVSAAPPACRYQPQSSTKLAQALGGAAKLRSMLAAWPAATSPTRAYRGRPMS